MSSILTNVSAMNAVSSLSATQSALSETQNQISTGLAVSSAKDNASYWSIATSMRSDVGALTAVSDSINLGSSVVSTAYQAISSSISILNQMKNLLVDAQTAGQDTTTIDTQLQQLQQQLRTFSNTATFNGVNLLATSSTASENVVTSFSKNSSGVDTVGFTDISLGQVLYSTANGAPGDTSYTGTGILDSASTVTGYSIDNLRTSSAGAGTDAATGTYLADEQNQIESAIASLTTSASTLGSVLSNLTAQGTFTTSLSNSLTSGVGSLVDADMNQASTKLNALQTQQQLGIQSLSIANQNSQLILKLFGG
ncbi:MAG: flagellin [Beijerinckiaceae bacterium]|nr:flagellin [Beijerinckiaceae bacterium]